MRLQLTSIQFRGGPAAIPLRRNPDEEPFCVPEWTPETASSAPVAYRLDRTVGSTVRVEAEFTATVAEEFEIKAEDATGRNLIGSIAPFPLYVEAGATVKVAVELDAPELTERGCVRAHDDVWHWYARPCGAEEWECLAETQHRVYTVLGAPNAPWGECVWTDALDVACEWAAGAANVDEAATMITNAFFALGDPDANPRLSYTGSGSYVFVRPDGIGFKLFFGLIDLIRYLNGTNPLLFDRVDCHDCAAAVSTFANLLGASLIQGIIQVDGAQIHTNVIRLIGGCEGASALFGEHEVAWSGNATERDRVWDACLAVDLDDNPGAAPHDFGLARGAVFRKAAGLSYCDRLAAGPDAAALVAPGPLCVNQNLELATQFPLPAIPATQGSTHVPRDLRTFVMGLRIRPWGLHEWYLNSLGPDAVAYLLILLLEPEQPDPRLHVQFRRCETDEQAGVILRGLRRLESEPPDDWPVPGDGGFQSRNGRKHVFRWANVVVSTAAAGSQCSPFADAPQQIADALAAAFGHHNLIR
jgi:hypothetical protein